MDIKREDRTHPPLVRVKGMGRQQQSITAGMRGVAVHSTYTPPNEQFTLPAVGHITILRIVIGVFKNHSTSWGYNVTDDNGLSHAISQ